MDQDATWYGDRPRRGRHCVRWGANAAPQKGVQQPPLFGPYLLWPNGRPSQQFLSSCFVLNWIIFTVIIEGHRQEASDDRLLSHVTLGRVECRKQTPSAQVAERFEPNTVLWAFHIPTTVIIITADLAKRLCRIREVNPMSVSQSCSSSAP